MWRGRLNSSARQSNKSSLMTFIGHVYIGDHCPLCTIISELSACKSRGIM